jgi:hypothetical protein
MAGLLARRSIQIQAEQPVLELATTGSETWPEWDRYLKVGGVPAYHLGNICGTCPYLFERLVPEIDVPQVTELDSRLATGNLSINDPAIDLVARLMPTAVYEILHLSVAPKLVDPGSSSDYFATTQLKNEVAGGYCGFTDPSGQTVMEVHHPHQPYYRLSQRYDVLAKVSGHKAKVFDFVVPMQPLAALNRDRVNHYADRIGHDGPPIAIALAVLDHKAPAMAGDTHICGTHFLVDGHHKFAAAARTGGMLELITFLARDLGTAGDATVTAYLDSFAR